MDAWLDLYTHEWPPEDEDFLVETYVGVCIHFNINCSDSALVGKY
jgi:hypothetical protein